MKRSFTFRAGQVKYANDENCWKAVVNRDVAADGKFYFSVKTTGVYCRPSCASRRARRENVQFHASCQAAERAGFRPCKRCQPNGQALEERYATTVAEACKIIETAADAPSLGELAKSVGMSPFHFQRVFKKLVGLTPKALAKALRADRVRIELSKRNTITEAIHGAGFNSNGRFYSESSKMLGMTPKKFRNGGSAMTIRFAVSESSFGSILVASSEQGVCAILLGDNPDELVRDVRDRFPKAELVGGDKKFGRLVAKVIRFVEAPKLGLNLPLDLRGTVFQRRVWQALCKIPVGETASYTEIARRIGLPKAIRAVAVACAANAIAVAVPCHRVVRTDGSLSGYRWGVNRKRSLLQREAGCEKI